MSTLLATTLAQIAPLDARLTALHLQNLIGQYPNVSVTRLARGLPTGSNIEFANRNILADAISGRQRM